MQPFVNPNIAGMTPYQPGKPVDELARELGLTDIVKLASNENPRGPGGAVQAAITAASSELSRYPDGNGYYLKQALAAHHQVDVAQITLGNGSNDVLELAAKMALVPGKQGIIAEHSFVVYRLAIASCGAQRVEVPARNFGADLDAMLTAVTADTSIIFLANPNNPTGTWVDEAALCAFLDALDPRVWVVLDEAYFEYVDAAGYPNGVALTGRYPNLIVTRTFSKIHALAALRVGYSISQPEAADLMNRGRQPFNVNSIAQAAAIAALADDEFVVTSREMNRAALVQLTEGLDRLGFEHIPSVGNFLCFDAGNREAGALNQALLREGVIVRPVAEYGLANYLRVSAGLPQENARFLESLERIVRS